MTDAPRGFGDFGGVWANADANYLYLGGHGLDIGGSNNVAVLFVGLDTLTDNAWNLWHKSGPPLALDFLHNVRFAEPVSVEEAREWLSARPFIKAKPFKVA